jgi:hypothetical protein
MWASRAGETQLAESPLPEPSRLSLEADEIGSHPVGYHDAAAEAILDPHGSAWSLPLRRNGPDYSTCPNGWRMMSALSLNATS